MQSSSIIVTEPNIALPALAYYYSVDRKYPADSHALYEFGAAAYIDFDRAPEKGHGGKTGRSVCCA